MPRSQTHAGSPGGSPGYHTALPGKGKPDAERCADRHSIDSTGRLYRCQKLAGHEGPCGYHRNGSQGGSLAVWWGANERPVGWVQDLGYAELYSEVYRLRRLCDEAGIDWRAELEAADTPNR